MKGFIYFDTTYGLLQSSGLSNRYEASYTKLRCSIFGLSYRPLGHQEVLPSEFQRIADIIRPVLGFGG